MLTASAIFALTLLLVIWQPKGLQIGTTAVLGALAALLGGVVSLDDVMVVVSIVWDATLAFVGIIILSMVLERIGFFEWCAIKMARLSRGNGHLMFVYSLLLGSFVAAFFANDGAALILTPILLAKMKLLRLNARSIIAFLLAGGFISDSASLPFVFSNLTNIVTVDYFGLGFVEYVVTMSIPFVVSVAVSTLVLWLLLHRDIPKRVDVTLLKDEWSVLSNRGLFYFSWFFLALLLTGYIVGDIYRVPVSFFALGGALLFLAIAALQGSVKAGVLIKEAPWQIVWFSIGLYIVVYGLKNAGLTHELAYIIASFRDAGGLVSVVATGFLSAVLSALMNNMPTIMIMDIAIEHINEPLLVYANIVGANLGPKMTPFGSLATLLWLHVLQQKGVRIGFWEYTKFGLKVTPPVLLAVLVSLYYWRGV